MLITEQIQSVERMNPSQEAIFLSTSSAFPAQMNFANHSSKIQNQVTVGNYSLTYVSFNFLIHSNVLMQACERSCLSMCCYLLNLILFQLLPIISFCKQTSFFLFFSCSLFVGQGRCFTNFFKAHHLSKFLYGFGQVAILQTLDNKSSPM